jgi:hypothetical protein
MAYIIIIILLLHRHQFVYMNTHSEEQLAEGHIGLTSCQSVLYRLCAELPEYMHIIQLQTQMPTQLPSGINDS